MTIRVPFSPPPGLVRDETQFAGGRWYNGSKVRFWNGKPQPIGGWTKLFANPLSGVPRLIFPLDRSGTVTLAYGTTTKLYVAAGSAQPTDRSPVGLPSGITSWSMAAWGSTLLASPKGGKLYSQTGTSTAAVVSQAPVSINRMLVTPERQVLALGCNEEVSTTFNGLCIRGCDLEDYTNWTTSSTNNAFEHILDGGGQIVAADLIGPYVAVWTETSLHVGQFIGDPSQTYRFDKVDDNCGCIGPDAVTVTDGRAYWMGPDRKMRAWAPGALPQVIECPISSLLSTLEYAYRALTQVHVNSKFNEVWIHFVGIGSTEITSSFAFSLRDGAWFRCGDMGRSAWLDSGLIANVLGSSYATTALGADSSGYVYIHETGSSADGSPMNAFITSAMQYLGEGERRIMITRCVPDFTTDSSAANLTVSAYQSPQDTDPTIKAFGSAVGVQKLDARVSGKLFTVDIRGADTNVFWRFGKLTFDVVPMGFR